jgi:hypothetical protein
MDQIVRPLPSENLCPHAKLSSYTWSAGASSARLFADWALLGRAVSSCFLDQLFVHLIPSAFV